MIYQVTPYEVYQRYLSLKQHFNKKNYDYFKFQGKVRANESSFEKRKDKHHFIRLSKIYKDEELTKFFVSNFVKSKDLWVGNATSPEQSQGGKEIHCQSSLSTAEPCPCCRRRGELGRARSALLRPLFPHPRSSPPGVV